MGAPNAGSCVGLTSVTSELVTVLLAPVERTIEPQRLFTNYTNPSTCVDSYVKVSISRPVSVTMAPGNDWSIRMVLTVTVDGVTQLLRSDQPSWRVASFTDSVMSSGMLSWDDVFVVGPGKRLEVYGTTVFTPHSGILVSNINEIRLGTGTVMVVE